MKMPLTRGGECGNFDVPRRISTMSTKSAPVGAGVTSRAVQAFRSLSSGGMLFSTFSSIWRHNPVPSARKSPQLLSSGAASVEAEASLEAAPGR